MEGKRIHPRAVETEGAVLREVEHLGEASLVARSSVRWGAIFAGVATAILSYLILMALGLAVASGTLRGAIQENGDLGGLGIGTAIWIVLATLISLFLGGYAAGRASGLVSTRIARTEGVVVAALFFLLLLMQAGSAIGTLGSGLGNVLGAAGQAVPDIAGNQQVQQVIEGAMGDLNLRSPPTEVAQGIAVRLLQGNARGARDYLASEAGISPQEAQARIDRFQADVQSAARQAGETATQVTMIAGWTLFLTFLLGGAAAVFGGHLGAQRNLRHPIDEGDARSIRRAA